MDKNLSATIGIVVGLMIVTFFVGSYLYAANSNTINWLNRLSWLFITITVIYWIIMVIRKKTRTQSTGTLRNIIQNNYRLTKWYIKWGLIFAVILFFLAFLFIIFKII